MIPPTTGAARAVALVLPEWKGKLDGAAIRVPVPDGSIIDLTFTPSREVTRDEVNAALKAASENGPLAAVLDYNDEPLVSADLVHPPASRSEEHTSELQSLMRISYAVLCLKQKTTRPHSSH